MGLYSHSRLATFETCNLQYKLKYIDKIKVDIDTIEKHLGKVVHEVLEKLYKDLLMGKMNTKDSIINYYEKLWERGWHDKMLIVNPEYEASHYWKRGQSCISDYWDNYYPFDHGKTIGLEYKVMFNLDSEGKHKIQGFIDRLVYMGDGVYEIHDYKTSSNPPSEDSLREDRQLALYQIDVQEKFSDAKEIKLIWHYLTFGKEFSSRRTHVQLEELKTRTIKLIDEVEATLEFNPRENPLCPWCDYQYLCPLRKHLVRMESLPLEEYLKDDGVKLVNKWVDLADQKRDIEKKLELLKEALIVFSQREGCNVIRGNTHKLRLLEESYWHFPGTGLKEKPLREKLEKLIKESGKFEDVFRIDVLSLSKQLVSGKLPKDLAEKIKEFGTTKITHRISQSKLEDDEIAD